MQIASCNVFVYQRSEIANFKSVKVNEPGRLYFDVTCRFTLHWVFGDTSNVVSGSVSQFNIITLLLWIYNRLPERNSPVFRRWAFLSVSHSEFIYIARDERHLTCAIDVLSIRMK